MRVHRDRLRWDIAADRGRKAETMKTEPAAVVVGRVAGPRAIPGQGPTDGAVAGSFTTTTGDARMLVLGRKQGESIRINDDIRITVVRAGDGGRVRIGIEAPRDCVVQREELWHQNQIGRQRRDRDG